MNDKPDDDIEFRIYQQKNCRIAYTLNNTQPVRCSIIGNEPLFFTDFGEDFDLEEDSFDSFFAVESIELGLAQLRAKVASFDSVDMNFAQLTDTRVQEFLSECDFITAKNTESDGEKSPDLLIGKLEKSRLAASLLDFAKENNVDFFYTKQVETALYDRKASKILINPQRSLTEQILLVSRELRRVWQHKQGALVHPLIFHPDQAILVNRVQIADVTIMMVRIAWELQLAEEPEAWERIEACSLYDLVHAFARESYLDFRTLNNGTACCAVFETWFLSDRCRIEDRQLIQQMLADYRGYVFEAEQSSRQVTVELIIALGSMPFGKNYLAPFVETIMNDAIFTDVRDRSNANFLWFIKFERSFRETEQELQLDMDVNDYDEPRGIFNNNDERTSGDEKAANVIFLPTSKAAREDSEGRQRVAGEKNKEE